jgi:hypothetical protein
MVFHSSQSLLRLIILLSSGIEEERQCHLCGSSLTYYETHLYVQYPWNSEWRQAKVAACILYVQAFKNPSRRELPTELNGERWLLPPSSPNTQPTLLP